MCWPDKPPCEDIDALINEVLALGSAGNHLACRGQANAAFLSLYSLLDRLLDPNDPYEIRLSKERDILERFVKEASEYLSNEEQAHVTGIHDGDTVAALTVSQHYGVPTRLVDWTTSPDVALYFAAIHYPDTDGAIWWYDRGAFFNEAHRRWEKYDLVRRPWQNSGIDLNDTAFEVNGPPWISEVNCVFPFQRIRCQNGFFTFAGRLGYDHAERISDLLKEGQYGRIIISRNLKRPLLNYLYKKDIHSKSLDYPGADIVGVNLKRELEDASKPPIF